MNETRTAHAAATPRVPAVDPPFVASMWEVARKEILQHIRTNRLVIIGSLFLASLFFVTFVVPVAIIGADNLSGEAEGGVALENLAFLFYLSSFFIGGLFFTQLLSIVLTADAVCSEWQNRTIFLLLSKPVSRTAFVLGKFAGSGLTVVAVIFVTFTLQYLFIQGFLPGAPSAEMVGRFFGATGIVILGTLAFAALSLFVSTLTRSTVMSLLLMLGLWIIVLPLFGSIGAISTLGDDSFNGDMDSWRMDWSRYIDPGASMAVAGNVLTDGNDFGATAFFAAAAQRTWLAVVTLIGHIVLWTGLAVLIVRRRNFE
jgi:Cu-processing system permease protein